MAQGSFLRGGFCRACWLYLFITWHRSLCFGSDRLWRVTTHTHWGLHPFLLIDSSHSGPHTPPPASVFSYISAKTEPCSSGSGKRRAARDPLCIICGLLLCMDFSVRLVCEDHVSSVFLDEVVRGRTQCVCVCKHMVHV